MTSTLVDGRTDRSGRTPPAPPAPARRTRLFALPEVRWAALAALTFLLALPLDLAGAPAWAWGPLYAVCYAAGGWEPGLAGLTALRERTLDVDLLMVVAAIGAAAIGQFLDGGLLIVIFAVSGALEALATRRTEDSVRGLLDLAPATAVRITREPGASGGADREERIEASALRVGDTVLVRPGERLPADGTVLDGTSEVDQATITGEPLPAGKSVGDEVFAGTLNGTGALRVRVGTDPSDSVIARIVAMVAEASGTKAPTQLLIEKAEQRYSAGVVVATLALFAVSLAFGAQVTATLLRAMTFMIVASPCAVVLATMPPLLSAIATAGRHGVLVKSAVAMEELGAVTRVAMDKTGTLTEGTPRVAEIVALPGTDESAVLTLAAAAEHASEHPLARAVLAAARERSLPPAAAHDFSSAPGRGVRAVVEGRTVQVGSPAALLDGRDDGTREASAAAQDLRAVAVAREAVADAEAAGRTAVVVLVDGEPAGVLALADRLRPGAPAAVARLAALTGTGVTLLTGDNTRAAARTAQDAGIADVRAGLLPQDKVTSVAGWQADGAKVLVVGDGVNDAPALAAAHSGVAMGRAGSDLALETADAVVVRDELGALPAVVALSRRARRLVVQNLCIASVCITALVVWDLAGHLPLPLGVLGHEGSTVLVGLNGLRLLRTAAWRRASDG
ncbi:heavy metal translocating P-type ATPase [Streptomyces pinistramenti]|uniref:heavy metal translocating P-type ATPase n=1 Tax=Streptomyces pinistramenti TaxID=2884812 RepID=UPI001D07ADB8|nr:heavy metal translocating P-type ATPase [Streptomyces pinistramenti]MCB5907828.1 heavy metal translocating P-type ATPase [Streptomyces pinistramenti]